MGKNLPRVLCLLLLLTLFTIPAFADMGPKPSVVVDFTGIPEGTVYYATLLTRTESTGPWSRPGLYGEPEPWGDETIWQKFLDYQDENGFHFLEYYDECTGTDQFIWGYYPPEVFKILIYFPETDTFAVTEDCYARYAFDSYYDAEFHPDGALTAENHDNTVSQSDDLSAVDSHPEPEAQNSGTLTAQRTHQTGWQIVAFLARLALTVAVEILLACLFRFHGRQLLVILGANVVTQILLNVVLLRGGYAPMFFVYMIQYGLLELLIFAAEATVYTVTLPRLAEPEEGTGHPILYAFTANLASFVLGYFISAQFPQLF